MIQIPFLNLTVEDCKYLSKNHFTLFRSWYHLLIVQFFIKPFIVFKYPYKVSGRDNVPKQRPFLVASNHISLLDPPLVSCATNLPLAYMAKKELFSSPLACWFFRSVGCFAVDRDATEVATIKTALAVLTSTGPWCLALFPQGTRNQEGPFLPLKKGGVSLAKKAKVPILPVGIYLNKEINVREVRIGTLVSTDNHTVEELTDKLTDIIKDLSQRA